MSKRVAYQPLRFIPPCQPTLVAEPPKGDDWLHEIKHDGYRTQLVIKLGQVRAFTRNGHDWSDRYRPLIEATASGLKVRTAIVDGEIIVQGEDGRSDFEALASAIRRVPNNLVFFAFDLLHLDGRDLTKLPLIERRQLLRDVIPADPSSVIQFSEHMEGNGPAFFKAVEEMGLEGMVSKRADSLYRSGLSRRWLKTKCWMVSDLIAVSAKIDSRGLPVAALVRETEAGFIPTGSAVIALCRSERERFYRIMEKAAGRAKGARLSVTVRHLKGSGALRHATVTGLRDGG